MLPFRSLWPNRHCGEIVASINGGKHFLCLNLNALAQLESAYGDTDILQLLKNFTDRGFSAQDVQHILRAGLCGARDALGQSDVALEPEGGYLAGVELAAHLIEAAFVPPAKSSSKSKNHDG